MYDTRPDLRSYVLTFRRLWWLLTVTALLGMLAMGLVGSGESASLGAVIQVNDLQSVEVIGQTGPLFDGVSEALYLSEDITAEQSASESGASAELTPRGARPTIDLRIEGTDEAEVDDGLAETTEALNERWEVHVGEALAPARTLIASRIASTKERLESLPPGASAGEADTLEKLRLQEQLIDDTGLLVTLERFQNTPPAVSVSKRSTSGGLSPIKFIIGAIGGVFVGLGIIIVATLFDTRVRRRSFIERNGLPVVAVAGPDGINLEMVPAGILAATETESGTISVVVASVDETCDISATSRVLSEEGFITVRGLPSGTPEHEFVDAVRSADAVVLVACCGESRYTDLLESARTAATSGAQNICAVLLTKNRGSFNAALD